MFLLGNLSSLLSSSASPQCSWDLFILVYCWIIVLASQAHHVSPFTLWDSAQLRSPLKRKEMKGWWLTQAESAHGGGAGITFPRLCYHRGSWVSAWLWHHRVWVRVMGAHGASQVILIYNFSFFSLPFPSITKQETMTRCECLFFGP